MGTRPRVFPEAFRRKAVERITSSGLSTMEMAQELELHETVLRRRVKQLAPQATGPSRRPTCSASECNASAGAAACSAEQPPRWLRSRALGSTVCPILKSGASTPTAATSLPGSAGRGGIHL